MRGSLAVFGVPLRWGDHHVFVGEVIEAHLSQPPAGRPDQAILAMSDLGDNVFYGG